ncbi:CBS domain-containing protein [Rheinheimera pacifica]|uniref:CBS domain-containing protein n=1 Tax=Rheinheimera pacifica TaxID=173990 RepID=UPI000CA9F24F|nr:CBS domain-containing protein [Rheinheimera pacifica]MDR6982228.1 CBS domain-containing protein [Rheinheimera pacifica]PKM17846.1 MAG: CBS domain-containing protein [Gammaproteobacteria bacterium HGW-Gammaproteobacteria-15]
MNVKDIMSTHPILVKPSTTIQEAAAYMAREGIGFLLAGADDELKGTLTDRDIVLRAVATGKDIENTTVADILTDDLLYCTEDQGVEEVARNMGEKQIRRLPVVNAQKRLVGVVSLGDIAKHLQPETAGKVLRDISMKFSGH